MDSIKRFSKITDLIIVVTLILAIPALSLIVTDLLYPTIKSYDPDDVFIYKTIHHLFQLVLTVVSMFFLSRSTGLKQWGFNLNSWQESLKWIVFFLVIYGVIQYLGISRSPFKLDYPMTTQNQIGEQFFQYCLSGLGEEPLFRGFVMVYLAKHWSKIYKIGQFEIPLTIVIATLLFMLAHVSFDLSSLSITRIDFSQQMMSLQLGILYGLAFHHTKSLLAPIVIHGISNGLIYTIVFYFVN